MSEDNTEDSKAQDLSDSAKSKSRRQANNQPLSAEGSTEGSKRGKPRKRTGTKRKKQNKKQDKLPDSEIVTVPIARKPNPSSGAADYWIDPNDVVAQGKKAQVSSSTKTDLSNDMKDKLKTEIASPYRQNWILLLIAAVVLLTLAYRFLPASQIFDHIPDL